MSTQLCSLLKQYILAHMLYKTMEISRGRICYETCSNLLQGPIKEFSKGGHAILQFSAVPLAPRILH